MTHVTHDPWVTGAVTPAQALLTSLTILHSVSDFNVRNQALHRFIDYPTLYQSILSFLGDRL